MESHDIYDNRLCDERHLAVGRDISNVCAKMELKIEAVKEANSLINKAADVALTLKTADINKRLEQLNQLRAEVVKDRDDFLRKESYDAKVLFYDKFVSDASQALTRMEAKYESRITFATILSIFSAIIAILAVLIPWLVHK